MRIKIKDDAARAFGKSQDRRLGPGGAWLKHEIKWAQTLRKIQGKWLDVETEFLFVDQFNTAPIPGISELGMRISMDDVDAIEDDARIGMQRCNYCGKCSQANDSCFHCGRNDYLIKFDDYIKTAAESSQATTET